eukprot:3091540-Pleurochrysis_carterae.AAC.1
MGVSCMVWTGFVPTPEGGTKGAAADLVYSKSAPTTGRTIYKAQRGQIIPSLHFGHNQVHQAEYRNGVRQVGFWFCSRHVQSMRMVDSYAVDSPGSAIRSPMDDKLPSTDPRNER